MKKFILILLSICLLTANSKAEIVDSIIAKKVAKTFYTFQFPNKSVNENEMKIRYKYTMPSNELNLQGQVYNVPLLYVVSITNGGGYVYVSADDRVEPILGYSENGYYSENNQPPAYIKWMSNYCEQIAYVIANNIEDDYDITEKWEDLKSGETPIVKGTKAVNPLLQTTWAQSPYYNALCPGGSVTGCVATAMAQIMKYWNWPPQGTGNHCYNENDYGYLCANFGSTSYNWSGMPDTVTSANTAVATLMYHCGVSVDMNYSPSLSGITDINKVVNAFETYFSYSSTAELNTMGSNTSTWIQLLKTELDAGRPVFYCGYGSCDSEPGGHAFVCDGYNNSNYFHFNWGWGINGQNDQNGYFLVTDLTPFNCDFSNNQAAIIGIQPLSSPPSNDIGLYSDISVTPSTLTSGQAFDVSVDIANYGTTSFTGDFTAAIFNNQGVFIDYVDTYSNQTLNGGYFYSFTFSNTGMSLPTGTYYIGIYSAQNSGGWMLVDEGTYTNPITITVQGATNSIALYQDIIQSPATLIQNQAASFTTDIANLGSTNFYGWHSAELYDLEGIWVKTIYSFPPQTLNAGTMYDNAVFSTSSLNVAPGMYALYILYTPDQSTYYITGSQYYSNPIYIEVFPAPLAADIYENNNTVTTSCSLPLGYSGNTAHKKTTGSNMHNTTDEDYYKIVLAAGYNYTITARVHDSYNSGDGINYTNDVLFSYRINNGTWSSTYDDVMPNNISVTDANTVYFHVSPYFAGSTGTYTLDLTVVRTSTAGEESMDIVEDLISIYPNPAENNFRINYDPGFEKKSFYQIIDITGKVVQQNELAGQSAEINIAELSKGIHYVKIFNGNKVCVKKLSKL
ncbi:MAG: C10 family peptidase [Spirochaetes bacterium]|nr:C10 family peptidase [Spirochaetota bacterium]